MFGKNKIVEKKEIHEVLIINSETFINEASILRISGRSVEIEFSG
jgi:hypothetical protein